MNVMTPSPFSLVFRFLHMCGFVLVWFNRTGHKDDGELMMGGREKYLFCWRKRLRLYQHDISR
jgi:hypothetical protein